MYIYINNDLFSILATIPIQFIELFFKYLWSLMKICYKSISNYLHQHIIIKQYKEILINIKDPILLKYKIESYKKLHMRYKEIVIRLMERRYVQLIYLT